MPAVTGPECLVALGQFFKQIGWKNSPATGGPSGLIEQVLTHRKLQVRVAEQSVIVTAEEHQLP
ncbi:MAG TPA: hypothetical protein VFQ44_00615 [Streptosporangiaceae bacterium]|nr:hypothetical protein [Streptosporangiaceae bacterium]